MRWLASAVKAPDAPVLVPMVQPHAAASGPRPWWKPNLTRQIVIALVVGTLVGWLWPHLGVETAFLRDIFLNLIKSLIAPLVFSSVVAGIAGGGDAKKVGRLGIKALVYFEVATSLALVVGLLVVNIARPGHGLVLPPNGASDVAAIAIHKPKTLIEMLVHIFPASIVAALADGDVLQIVAFAAIFGLAVVAAGERARPVAALAEAVTAVMFKFTDIIMKFAPLGVGAAIAVTVGQKGLGVLLRLGLLVGSLYVALVIFLGLLFLISATLLRLPMLRFWRAVRAPFILAFATASSESALPQAMESMVELGVPKDIVGFVIPAGYTLNLDGTTLYLALASVFIAQAAESGGAPHFGIGQQIALMLTLMIASKGVAAVPRASLVVLVYALDNFGLPREGIALILGVDALMDMARTSVNVLGNCLASVIVAKWEGEFDCPKSAASGYSPST